MKIYEIGTGYTPIPAQVAAATESIVEELTKAFMAQNIDVEIIDICAKDRAPNSLPITEVKVPSIFSRSDVSLGIVHKLKRVVYSWALAGKLKKLLKATDEKVVCTSIISTICFSLSRECQRSFAQRRSPLTPTITVCGICLGRKRRAH